MARRNRQRRRRCRGRLALSRIAAAHGNGGTLMARVLVVDDDAGIRESAAMALQKAGHRPFAASDAEGALQSLREHRVDVVVSDIYMPGQDGLALLQSIGERKDPPRVILMTARGTIETAALAS